MLFLKRFISIFVAFLITLPLTFLSASAAEDFTMKSFDKGYITFIFDDGKMPFTKEVAELFKEYNMPMSCAIIANRVQKDSEEHKILLNIQQNGGEILSHGYNHIPITSEERSNNPVNNIYGVGKGIFNVEDIENELGSSWKRLTNLGFNINGMIQVGCGGDENTADYALVESIARKYYKYSNASGVSAQYIKSRTFMNWKTMSGIKQMINTAIENKEWIILSAHNYNEISSDAPSEDTGALREILQYIKSKNGAIEVVTWNYIYNTFGEYSGTQVPTAQALEFLNVTDNDDKETLNKNAYVEKPVEENSASQVTSVNEISSESTVSSETQSDVSSQVSSVQSQPTVTTGSAPIVEAEIVEKTNTGKYIAIIVAVAIALASVVAAIIVFLKFK